jgi:tRNA threonylcarbamoyladenosine biosynthesis protein TsaE
MGVGKTTIIKAICKLLDVVDLVSSPTFTLVNEYKTSGGDTIYHIDFYRIKKQEEVFDFGVEEYWSGDSYCFMEWPELVGDILPEETVSVRIIVDEDEQRILLISK